MQRIIYCNTTDFHHHFHHNSSVFIFLYFSLLSAQKFKIVCGKLLYTKCQPIMSFKEYCDIWLSSSQMLVNVQISKCVLCSVFDELMDSSRWKFEPFSCEYEGQ